MTARPPRASTVHAPARFAATCSAPPGQPRFAGRDLSHQRTRRFGSGRPLLRRALGGALTTIRDPAASCGCRRVPASFRRSRRSLRCAIWPASSDEGHLRPSPPPVQVADTAWPSFLPFDVPKRMACCPSDFPMAVHRAPVRSTIPAKAVRLAGSRATLRKVDQGPPRAGSTPSPPSAPLGAALRPYPRSRHSARSRP